MDVKFSGPVYRHSIIWVGVIIYLSLLFISLIWPTNSWMQSIVGILIMGIVIIGISLFVDGIERKSGSYAINSNELRIYNDCIVSKEHKSRTLTVDKIIKSKNIEKIKVQRDLTGFGLIISVWPKNYEELEGNGFDWLKEDPKKIDVYKKYKYPVYLVPPALRREERKRLKEAIDEFKRINGIE